MKLHEYQSKLIFSKYDIRIPEGRVTSTASNAKQIAEELGGRVVIKAQVLVGGRGKAGGIRLAKSPMKVEEVAAHILGMKIKEMPVHKVLVEEAVNIDEEIYLGITNDRSIKRPVMIAIAQGGVDIEEVAKLSPEKICKIPIDPLLGLREYQARYIATGIDLKREYWRSFVKIAYGLWQVFSDSDATLAEINPLVITDKHRLVALDGKVIMDDNACFRHPDLSDMRDMDIEYPTEIEARKYGLSYVKMNGQVGCMANGAGLALATMDIIKLFGGEPANFLDIGEIASAEKVTVGLHLLLTDPEIQVVFINIFGVATHCDEIAYAILNTISNNNSTIPIVVRFIGANAGEGVHILEDAQMITAETMVEATQKVVSFINGGWLNEHFD